MSSYNVRAEELLTASTIQQVLYRSDKRGQPGAWMLVFRTTVITELSGSSRPCGLKPAAEAKRSWRCGTHRHYAPSEGLAPQETYRVFRSLPEAGEKGFYGMRMFSRTLPQRSHPRDARDHLNTENEAAHPVPLRTRLTPFPGLCGGSSDLASAAAAETGPTLTR